MSSSVFFFNATPPTAIYTLSLHDALPIFVQVQPTRPKMFAALPPEAVVNRIIEIARERSDRFAAGAAALHELLAGRSEEHTSELQSQFHLVCRLLLEKKKKTIKNKQAHII